MPLVHARHVIDARRPSKPRACRSTLVPMSWPSASLKGEEKAGGVEKESEGEECSGGGDDRHGVALCPTALGRFRANESIP